MRAAAAALAAGLAILAAPFAPAAAQASDFTITVPVNLSGIPSNITRFGVSCYIMPEDYGDASHQLAYGATSVDVHGSYRGNLTISFNAAPGKDPSLARWYRCVASFTGTDRGRPGVIFFPNGPTSTPNFPLVAGAPLFLGNFDRWIRIPGH